MIKVLVSNDDGIDAVGIKALVEALAPLADVYVFAPGTEQSAKSQSITFLHPITIEAKDMKGAVAAYAVDGTPTDCVMVGMSKLAKEGIRPDYVISGINLGYNSGLAAYYSGTIAAAREGALNGVRSIALSAGAHDATEFEYMLNMLPMLMEMAGRITPGVLLSVNVPNLPASEIKGYKVLEAAPFGYGINFKFTEAGENLYQMGGEPARIGDTIRYDFDANEAGYASISPIPTSMSDPVSLSKLQNAYAQDKVLGVIVDAQSEIAEDLHRRDDFEMNLGTLAKCLDRMDMPVLICRRYDRGEIIDGVRDNCSRSEVVERMEPDPWMAVDMTKYTSLIEAGHVLLAGAETNVSLLQTARGFIDRGYEVTILEDCCAASGPDEHRKAIIELKELGCEITGVEAEIMRLVNSCNRHTRESVERLLRR